MRRILLILLAAAMLAGCSTGVSYSCLEWELTTFEAGQYVIGTECTVIIGPLPDQPVDPEGVVL